MAAYKWYSYQQVWKGWYHIVFQRHMVEFPTTEAHEYLRNRGLWLWRFPIAFYMNTWMIRIGTAQSRGCDCLANAVPNPHLPTVPRSQGRWLHADCKASSSGTSISRTGLGCQVSHRVPRPLRSCPVRRPFSTCDADAYGGGEAREGNWRRGLDRITDSISIEGEVDPGV